MSQPVNVAAEANLIGNLLLDPSLADRVLALKVDSFTDLRHKAIVRAVSEIRKRGERADRVTIQHEAGDAHAAYLTALATSVDREAFPQHLDLVREKAASTALLDTLRSAAGELKEGKSAATVSASLGARIAALATGDDGRLHYLADVLPDALERIAERKQVADTGGQPVRGLLTGVAPLDDLTGGANPGEEVIIAALPGAGKTALVQQMVLHSAFYQDAAAICFNLEMTRLELAERAMAHRSLVDSYWIRRGQLSDDTYRKLLNDARDLAKLAVVLEDRTFDLGGIVAKARAWRARHPKKRGLITVDFAQMIVPESRETNRVEVIADVARTLKKLGKELESVVVLVSQFNRDASKQENGNVPKISQLYGGAALEQAADIVILGYGVGAEMEDTPDLNDPSRFKDVDFKVAKARGGPTGVAQARFYGQYYLFTGQEGLRR